MKWCWLSAGAKARAEQEFASARTQQEAERAEQAIKDTAAALKEIMRLKVTLSFPPQIFILNPFTLDPSCSAVHKLVRLGCNNQSYVFGLLRLVQH